jgi:two-component sensor histidine kinase
VVLPLLVGLTLAAFTLVAWQWQVEREAREPLYRRAHLTGDLARLVVAAIEREVEKAGALAGGMARSRAPADEFASLANVSGVSRSRAYLTAAWVNAANVCEAVWPAAGAADPVLQPGAAADKRLAWQISLRGAREHRQPQVIIFEPVGTTSARMVFVFPATSGEGESAGFQGYVVARLDLAAVLARTLGAPEFDGYDRELQGGGFRLAGHGRPIARQDVPDVEARAVMVMNRALVLRVRRAAGAAPAPSAGGAGWVLWGGLMCSAGAALVTGYAGRTRRREAVLAERRLAVMQSLTQTGRVMSAAPGAAREALDGLAVAARALLRTRLASVWVLDAAGQRVEAVARAGYAGRLPQRSSYLLDEVPGTGECIRRADVVVIDDVETERRFRVNRVISEYALRSAMIVPLIVERAAIGALFLGHERPGAFGEAERRLGRLLGSQAGVVLMNLRLHEQKDAALAAQKELARRHEALYQIATEIFRGQDLEASLQRMADAAPGLLGLDLCLVSMREGAEHARVAALTGNFANCVGEVHSVRNTNFGRVWESKRPLVIEDGPNDHTLHPGYRHRLHVGSVMYLPLLGGDGEAIGAMMLVRHATGGFAPDLREMAVALAARAAVAIETARLHEGARRAAQTQAMLLRELNHRVKNNLASIVALLGMERPPMPADALAWVNRVSDRISTMARTHELFVGGADRVDLRELVGRLMPALSLIKPAGAEVRTELDGVRVELGTERAVSLAMVLNELCWNALEHGTGAHGVLCVRASPVGAGRLVLEGVDGGGRAGNGNGDGVPGAGGNGHGGVGAAVGGGRGSGLRLVEGLVSRELRGRVAGERPGGGGTVARVEIPLEADEAPGVSLGT